MADLIAILVLGLQYSMIVFVVSLFLRTALSFAEVTIPFLILASIGIVFWRRDETVQEWKSLAVLSIVLGGGFFGVDFLVSLLNGQANPFHFPGGLLALPLTFLICPVGTIICFAGLARASYISKRAASPPST